MSIKNNIDDQFSQNNLKSFQDLWVAGTLGAFFVAFASNLPTHILLLKLPINIELIQLIFLKYGYLLWFTIYFFISNLRNKTSGRVSRNDIVFDIVQSVVALTSAYALGFLDKSYDSELVGYMVCNFSILIICILSLCFFCHRSSTKINEIRVYTAIFSVLSIIAVFLSEDLDSSLYPILTILLIFLLLLLYSYTKIRLKPECLY